MYYRRPPHKRLHNYILPFVIIVVIFGGVIFGWRALNNAFIEGSKSTTNEKVFLNIENGSAKAMTVGSGQWQNAPDKIYLYRGEKLKTGPDGRATLTFFDQSLIRLNTSTEVAFATLKKKNETEEVAVDHVKGDIWVKVGHLSDQDSSFSVNTDLLVIESKGSVYAVTEPGTVYMIQGTAQIGVKADNEVVKTFNIGVGQQFIVDKESAQAVEKGEEVDLIFALSDQFKKTNWYRWNRKADSSISAFEESDLESLEDELEAMGDDEEIDDSDPEEDEEEAIDPNDKTPPEVPVILIPDVPEGELSVEIDEAEQLISGTVSEDTEAVIVNDYRLGLYVPGSGEYNYYAKIAYGNLEAGDNEYKVVAEDKAGNQSEPATITLTLPQEVVDEYEEAQKEKEGQTSTDEDSLPQASSEGGVSITAPNGGESFTSSETEFEIIGKVPEGTSKVEVNDYPLSLFTEGDTTFSYRAKVSFKNLFIGEKNTYTAKAFDSDGKLLGTASITIDIESGSGDDPVINIPSENETYSTTLDTLVVGGSVGKWVTRMYINNKEIKNYIPGSEKFSASVTLNSGINKYTITAEKQGEEVGSDVITITFQQ